LSATWIGKTVGGVLGYLIGGPIGGLIGVAAGHQFDQGVGSRGGSNWTSFGAGAAAKQRAFFATTFAVMGHIAKADGRVTAEEIRAARGVMHRMQLTPELTREAIARFTVGKDANFPLTESVTQMRRALGQRRDLCRAFMEIQMEAVVTSGAMRGKDRDLLWRVAQLLDIGRVELVQIEALVRAQRYGPNQPRRDTQAALAEAYGVLGVEAAATDKEVKTAYRRLMNQHHPDKLVARGLPESMMNVAKEKTREINAAYDLIKGQRGFS
jgi:DnaJ like chaperone protein